MNTISERRASRIAGRSAGIPRDRLQLSAPFAGPTEEVERCLLRLWEDVLGVRGLGVLDDFFEAGGDSFAATTMIGEIEHLFGRALPPSVLLKCRSVRALADLLRLPASAAHARVLLPIRPSGKRLPLFVVHAARGDLLFLRHLLPHLDPEQPVYGLQARGLVDGDEPHRRFEAMAADYTAVIRSVQPQGPYLLAGYCVGGLIAVEIARILQDAGEEIRFLGMIDPNLHPSVVPWLRWAEPDAISARLQRAVSRVLWHARRRRLATARRAIPGKKPPALTPAQARRQQAVYSGVRIALKAYRPSPYGGKVTIFFSSEHRTDFECAATRRHALASRIDIVEVGALHEQMFTVETAALGGALQRQLDRLVEAKGDPLAA